MRCGSQGGEKNLVPLVAATGRMSLFFQAARHVIQIASSFTAGTRPAPGASAHLTDSSGAVACAPTLPLFRVS